MSTLPSSDAVVELREVGVTYPSGHRALVGVNLDLVGVDDGRTLLALADATTKRERLLEGQPMRRGIALGHGGNP